MLQYPWLLVLIRVLTAIIPASDQLTAGVVATRPALYVQLFTNPHNSKLQFMGRVGSCLALNRDKKPPALHWDNVLLGVLPGTAVQGQRQ